LRLRRAVGSVNSVVQIPKTNPPIRFAHRELLFPREPRKMDRCCRCFLAIVATLILLCKRIAGAT